jgi:antitoxin component YwqK of YwqJK toxin-antitoxin module
VVIYGKKYIIIIISNFLIIIMEKRETWHTSENGEKKTLKQVSFWENGVETGEWEEFYPGGQIKTKSKWISGVEVERESYYPKFKQLRSIKKWDTNGEEDGNWLYWFQKQSRGEKMQMGFSKSWKNGIKHGKWENWVPTGDLSSQQTWNMGRLIDEKVFKTTFPTVLSEDMKF